MKAVRALSFLCAVLMAAGSQAQNLPDNYAESVMILAMSDDGRMEVSLRLARFPGSGKGTVWLHIAHDSGAWSLADESFELDVTGATPVAEDSASFSARKETQSVRFDSARRNSGRLYGKVTGNFLASATRHPELGTGEVPVKIELEFNAASAGYRDNGRWEMTGQVYGVVTVANLGVFTFLPGKWHEQTGPRAAFAPAFRYLNLQNEDVAILAIQYENRFRGYASLPDGQHALTSVAIDPPAVTPRRFSLTLDDGRTIEGSTSVVQEWSVPIEGQRRPGSSVVADTNLGSLAGSLNDWEPEP